MLELLSVGGGLEVWRPQGDVSWLHLGASRLIAAVQPDEAELRRRGQHGLRAVKNRRLLATLVTLPSGVAVPWNLIQPRDRVVLEGQSESIVERLGEDVTVVLRPALKLLSVGAVASSWRRGLRLTSPFASYCARYVVLSASSKRRDTAWAETEARFYGIGLAELGRGGLRWRVAPAPFTATRFTAASWLMAERVLDGLGGRPAPRANGVAMEAPQPATATP
jgi:hypothetical protein